MTDLVPTRKAGKSITLADLQNLLDSRADIAKGREVVSTKKARIEQAKENFKIDPEATVDEIHDLFSDFAKIFDPDITLDSVPLNRAQINTLSEEYRRLDQVAARLEALMGRYRATIFAHLDETVDRIPGRPVSQTPGKVEADGPGEHYIFERRGGNRANPDLDTKGLREELPAHIVAQIFATVTRPAVEAYTEEVFDEAKFGELVNSGAIDMDLVAKHLKAGKWREPSFHKTLVEGE